MATTAVPSVSSLIFDAAASLMVASMVVADFNGVKTNNTTTWKNCTLVASHDYTDQLSSLMSGPPAKLIEMDIELDDRPPDILKKWLKSVHKPNQWIRSMGRQGQSLLSLEESYSLMSLTALSIGVYRMSFNVTEQPRACLDELSPDEVMRVLRNAFLVDFKVDEDSGAQSTESTLGDTESICNLHVVDENGYAVFRYQCCRRMTGGRMECLEVEQEGWIKVLLGLIILLKIVSLLYSPIFLPESIYRLKYVTHPYIHRFPNGVELPLNVVVTADPSSYGANYQDKTVRLSRLRKMEYFKTLVSSSAWQQDKIYQVKVKDIRFSVKARRLLGQTKVPVGVVNMIYKNFFRCRITKLETIKYCCDSSILGRCSGDRVVMKWSKCMQLFSALCQLLLVAFPWVVRSMVYWIYEYDMIQERLETADRVGLDIHPAGSLVSYLTPLHGVFLFIYVIIVIDTLFYGVITTSVREKLYLVIRQCLRNMKERPRMIVCSWSSKLLMYPFYEFGLLGFIIFPFYFVFIAFVLIPVAAFYIFPTVNLTFRLLIHLFIFLCPRRVTHRMKRFSSKMSGLKDILLINEVTAKETFVERSHQSTVKGLALQLCTILLCLVTFWSVTLLFIEIVSFSVEVLCYTFMGVVVNAGVTLQYFTVLVLVFWHGRNSCRRVHDLYRNYHKLVHDQIVAMKKDEIDEVAKRPACDQQNTAFRVVGNMSSLEPRLDMPVLRVKGDTLQWLAPGMLAFLNRHDRSYTPERFFARTINLKYSGCPGPVYINVMKALWDFFKIVLFLVSILIIVLAFGNAYQISSTNQLLATVAGSLVPFFFHHFFNSDTDGSGFNPESVQFKTELHSVINQFEQAWPVFDIIHSSLEEVESDRDSSSNTFDNQNDSNRIRDTLSVEKKVTPDSDPVSANHRIIKKLGTRQSSQTQNPPLHSSYISGHSNSDAVSCHSKSDLNTTFQSNSNDRNMHDTQDEINANSWKTSQSHNNTPRKVHACDESKSEISNEGHEVDTPLINAEFDNHTSTNKIHLMEETLTASPISTTSNHFRNSSKHSASLPLLSQQWSSKSQSEQYKISRAQRLKRSSIENGSKIDLILDISTSKKDSFFMELGSVSMLNDTDDKQQQPNRTHVDTPSSRYYKENLV